MKQVFIINEYSVGTKYGIGSYTKQLVHCLTSGNEWNIYVVELFSPIVTEFTLQKQENATFIQLPILSYFGDKNQYRKINARYYRSSYFDHYIIF